MNYDIELSRIALKNMGKIPKRDLIRIQIRLESLATEPLPDGVKKIRGDDNLYRIGSGNYRILYRIFEERLCVLVIDIDHRKDIYKDL